MNRRINLIKNIFMSNFMRLPLPYKITLALTYRCNLRCKICRIWKHQYNDELTIKNIEIFFKNLNHLSWIDLTGGELTLREDIVEIIKVIIKNSKRILIFHISTNGQLPEKILLLAKEILRFNLIPIINVSIDGPRVINDQLRGVEGAYLNSLETFKKLKQLNRGYYYISCTISNYNINYIDDLVEVLKKDIPDFAPYDLHFNIFHNSPHYYNNIGIDSFSGVSFDTVKKYFALSQTGNSIKIFLEKGYIKGLSKYCNGNRFPVRCQALNSSCFINPQGTVYPCGIYNKPVGELKDYDFNLKGLWYSPNALKIKKEIMQRKCPGCWSPCEAYPAILGCTLRNLFFRRQ